MNYFIFKLIFISLIIFQDQKNLLLFTDLDFDTNDFEIVTMRTNWAKLKSAMQS